MYRSQHRVYRLQKNYGLSVAQFEAMRVEQNNKCAICGSEFGIIEVSGEENRPGYKKSDCYIDHDHETGKNRELLCHRCNCGLGHFRDDIETLKLAIAYLDKHKE